MTDRDRFEAWIKEHIEYDADTGLISVKKEYIHKPAGSILGGAQGDGYLRASFKGRRMLIHRMAWFLATGKWSELQIDHINGIRTDNRLCNLREATHSQNCINAKTSRKNKTGVKGVHFANGKYIASISINNKTHSIGRFESLEDAKIARRTFAESVQGEFVNHG
jgi:hypothetical protein